MTGQNLKAEEIAVTALKTCGLDESRKVYFSVATDTFNKGNRKMYPIRIQQFSREDGCQTQLLDFFECPFETADAILNTLSKFDLDVACVSAFSADKTNANFGRNRSAFTLLKDKNPNIMKAGCLAHVLNNTFKHAMNKLNVDVETVILKIYSHFSSSALRRENLIWNL